MLQMNAQVPFGGRKQSGYGREFGEYVRDEEEFVILSLVLTFLAQALRAYTEPKTILIK